MKTLIIAGVAAFGLGAAGGTGYRLATAPPKLPPGQTAAAVPGEHGAEEAAAVDPEPAAPITAGETHATTMGAASHATAATPPEQGVPAAAPPAPAPDPAATEAPATASETPTPESAGHDAVAEAGGEAPGEENEGEGPAEFKQLAKILANMKPAEAAGILGHLTDEQVASVFGSMNPRAAALVLAEIPPERGAAVGRILAARAKPEK
jgi:hypothetical protein